MTLKEVAIVINDRLQQKTTVAGGFYATFQFTEIMKEGSRIFASPVAFGDTKKEARKGLCDVIAGKILVKNACQTNERQYQLPPVITTR